MKKITSLVLGLGFLLSMTAFAQDASTPTDSTTKTTTKHKKKHKKNGTTETTDQSTTKTKPQ